MGLNDLKEGEKMEEFIYKKSGGITALSANITDFSYKNHSHSEYAIGVTKSGIQRYHLDGKLQLSYQDGIMLFNPEQVHDGMAHDKSGLEYIMLYIEPAVLLDAAERKEAIQFTTPVIYNSKIESDVYHLANAIFHENEEEIVDEQLIKLVDDLVNQSTIRKHVESNAYISKIKGRILYGLKENLKITDLAHEFGMSKFQFIRYFKEQTGITPYQFLLNSKIEEAKNIIEIDKDIHLAVSELGFSDLIHLNRQFKKIYGITANNYAQSF